MSQLTSRQRLLRAIDHGDVDHIPCCFMSFAILRKKHGHDRFAAALGEQQMGLDPMLFIPSAPRSQRPEHPDLRGLPLRFHPAVTSRTWREGLPASGRLFREYHTPAGKLSTSVRLSDDWPHGDHIPFVDDYQLPRLDHPLVRSPSDLEALQFLLQPSLKEDSLAYEREAAAAQDFARRHGLLLAGGWGVGMDMANWLCGMQDLMMACASSAGSTIQQPDFVGELLRVAASAQSPMIHRWNMQRMQVVLSAPVDLFIRRAWYEGCDFVTPRFFHRRVLPSLKAEVELAHEHGARFGYICTSGVLPMLDAYLEAGIDVLIGVDPIQGTHTDMPAMKARFAGRVCLWGGVSAAVTVERGGEEEVRTAVRLALETLGPRGFILSPVDNLTVDEPLTWHNLDVFIDEWKSRRRSPQA